MQMVKFEILVPQEMIPFLEENNQVTELERNAMLMYPMIQNETISHGKAAELLGINKIELISFYGKMGVSYFNMTEEELEEDLSALASIETVTI